MFIDRPGYVQDLVDEPDLWLAQLLADVRQLDGSNLPEGDLLQWATGVALQQHFLVNQQLLQLISPVYRDNYKHEKQVRGEGSGNRVWERLRSEERPKQTKIELQPCRSMLPCTSQVTCYILVHPDSFNTYKDNNLANWCLQESLH